MTEPISAVLTSAGTAIQDYMTSLAAWCATLTNFTRSNVVGAPVTSFTLTHNSLSFQLNFRVSGGDILVGTAPDGGVSDSAVPGTPTGWNETIGIDGPVTSPATRIDVSEEFDAISFLIQDSTNAYIIEGFHVGKIVVPLYSNDPDKFIDGHAILAGLPNVSSSANLWFTTGATRSRIRVAENTWWDLFNTLDFQSNALRSGPSGERPCAIAAAADTGVKSTSTSPRFGVFKYIFQMGVSTRVPLSVKPAATGNQGYLHLNKGALASATNFAIRWNSAVTP